MSGIRPTNFIVQEFVDRDVFEARGQAAWDLLCPKLLIVVDTLRKRYGPINNWHTGGPFHESGLRDPFTKTGAKWSMHKLGRAVDLKFSNVTPIEVQEYILSHPEEYGTLTCMENAAITKTWLHADTRNHDKPQQLWVVDP